jgi:Bacterial protein of unknown function (DUF839)
MHRTRMVPRLALGLLIGVAVFVPSSLAGHSTEPPYITMDVAGGTATSIIESGDVHDGIMFEGIPDGIGVTPGAAPGTVDVFVTHEQSHVPFQGTADIEDASVTRWTITTGGTPQITDASEPIGPEEGFIRFCSAFMAGPAEGFATYTFFANEESDDDLDVPAGAIYGPDPAIAPKREAGYAVVLDAESENRFTHVPGMGRHNHENSVVVPGGWNQFAVLSTDDTFNAPSSQLYMYLANHERHIWEDKGSLWAFRVTGTNAGPVDPENAFNGANDYGDIRAGDDWQGEFIRVPKEIARGQTADPPQKALEDWSNANNVFQFIRLEDIAYDRNNPRVVYIADTGERRAVPNPATGRLMRGPSGGPFGPYVNGRIFRFVFDSNNPRKVTSFSILLDADAGGPNNPAVMHQPDNMDTSASSLMVQEDSSQPPNSRIWRYEFATRTWSVVAHVNENDWESSGIVDASQWFGAGAWLLDVQAHGADDYVFSRVEGGVTIKREGGQLLLMRVPGS